MRRLLIVAALLVSACKCAPMPAPSPAPAPTPSVAPVGFDAGRIGPPYNAACENLKELGCVEGAAFDCAAVMQRADATHLTLVPTQCLIVARSKDDARSCGGFVKCP